jgi:hypothetical protein
MVAWAYAELTAKSLSRQAMAAMIKSEERMFRRSSSAIVVLLLD